jgi:hypothetical protein
MSLRATTNTHKEMAHEFLAALDPTATRLISRKGLAGRKSLRQSRPPDNGRVSVGNAEQPALEASAPMGA